ncbi:hypothetical protein HMPREF0293_1232 [Corynebacterium glucuronolyticum ATCC 51866]|uniref:Uncharacterized protein n=1 Tax=Corynebacterium glucuronolyticum ATCC 51866 TaxID=548478 RepID=A0ABM9XQ73_9CORY|nr:hypothetical protein HMPREF0293_1232 [Corynebacterium glucuronolyticum ATCC 51866]
MRVVGLPTQVTVREFVPYPALFSVEFSQVKFPYIGHRIPECGRA